MSAWDGLEGLDSVLGKDFMAQAMKDAGRMEQRRLAGIPSFAEGPWDDALDITARAEKVAKQYRDLAGEAS